MKVLFVYPISRGISKEKLSYFCSTDIPPGSIIDVPLRSRFVPALVVESHDAEHLKAELKLSEFALRKVAGANSRKLFSPAFIKAVESAADYFAAAPGAVLFSLVPKSVLDKLPVAGEAAAELPSGIHEKFAVQAGDEERFSHYKSLIREEFARSRSVFFALPTIEDIKEAEKILPKGIEDYSFAFHSKMQPKKLLAAWNAAIQSSHPVLIIGTVQFLSIPRPDLQTVIVEKESSRNYRTVGRPFLNLRVVAEKFAEEARAKFVVGDLLLRTETLYAHATDRYAELSPLKFRSLSPAATSIIDMRTEADEDNKRFRVLSEELVSLIEETKNESSRLFLFGTRKGYASSTVCADCGEIVRCNNCGAPVSLHMKSAEENYFFCNKCGEKRSAAERCSHCESWNLTMLGIGVERIEEELAARFPDAKIFRLDKESVSTEKQARAVIEKFRETTGAILIGTELALFYLKEPVENTAIVSIDTLFAVPDFRINEKLFHILLRMRGLALSRFLIQTRLPEEKIFTYAGQGNLTDFYRSEIEARKQFQYPPYSIFIKISLEGPRAHVENEMRKIKKFLEPFQADLLASFDSPHIKRFTMHALLKIKSEEWPAGRSLGEGLPNPALLEKLRALPPSVSIRVDPDTLI